MQICMCICETYTKKGVCVGMCMWDVIPWERIVDLHNQHINAILYKTEYQCSRVTGSPIWDYLCAFGRQINQSF